MIFFKYLLVLIFSLGLVSCGEIKFTYKEQENLTNPIYNKTKYNFSGKDIVALNRYASIYFGKNNDPAYYLSVKVEEEKIKKSIKSNQAASKIDYKLTFDYSLSNQENECVVFKRKIFSRFSYVPKSSGYNFGSDQSLEKMYELAAKENLGLFINHISEKTLDTCINAT